MKREATTRLQSQNQIFFLLRTFHFQDGVLGHFLPVPLHLLLRSLLEVLVGRADHHGLALEAGKQAHLPLLAGGGQVGLQGGREGLKECEE